MRPIRTLLVLLLLGGVLGSPTLLAQTAPPRAKIAVVLSGGGARGLAHIGVLEWFDEHHIPVDYVTGTSMGGIVGAFYATGATGKEIETFVEKIDWDTTLLSEPRYDQLSFRRKEDRRGYEVQIPLGLAHGLSGPNALNPGHGVGLFLNHIALGYSELKSFDDLPIPFRCVATDMLQGTPVVLKEGSLSQALRATMAIPGILTPVERGATVLADGGLVNNIPTDVARDLGAPIVIAVDVSTPLGGKESLLTLGGVLTQTIAVVSIENQRRNLRRADIIVSPDLEHYSVADYNAAEKIIRLGYEAAALRTEVLSRFSIPEEEWKAHLAARQARRRKPDLSVDAVEVAGIAPDQSNADRLERRMLPLTEDNLSEPKVAARLTHIVGEGRFDSLGYELVHTDGAQALRVLAHEKNYGPPFLDLAVNVNGNGVGQFDFSAGVRATFMDVAHRGGELRADLLLGSTNLIAGELYQPIGNSHFFVVPSVFLQKRARNVFQNGQRVAQNSERTSGGGLDLGVAAGRRAEIRFGYHIYDAQVSELVGVPQPRLGGATGQFRLAAVFDGQDSAVVPSRGLRFDTELLRVIHTPGASSAFQQFQIRGSQFLRVGPKGSFFLNGAFGTSFDGVPGPLQLFSLGGPFRLGAYQQDELRGRHYGLTTFGYRREVYRLPAPLGKGVYIGSWYDIGSTYDDPARITVRHSFNAGFVSDTILGAVALTGGVSPTGRARINFSIGRFF